MAEVFRNVINEVLKDIYNSYAQKKIIYVHSVSMKSRYQGFVTNTTYHSCMSFIIWHYQLLWGFSFSAKSLPILLSVAVSFQLLTFSFLDLP